MAKIDDDYLTNLSWLKSTNNKELQSTVECTNNHIDDDLQCLCWLIKIRPTNSSPSSRSVKRLSVTKNKVNPQRKSSRLSTSTYKYEQTLKANDISTSRQVLIVRLINTDLSSEQSFLLIRSSTGQISCFTIRHFV